MQSSIRGGGGIKCKFFAACHKVVRGELVRPGYRLHNHCTFLCYKLSGIAQRCINGFFVKSQPGGQSPGCPFRQPELCNIVFAVGKGRKILFPKDFFLAFQLQNCLPGSFADIADIDNGFYSIACRKRQRKLFQHRLLQRNKFDVVFDPFAAGNIQIAFEQHRVDAEIFAVKLAAPDDPGAVAFGIFDLLDAFAVVAHEELDRYRVHRDFLPRFAIHTCINIALFQDVDLFFYTHIHIEPYQIQHDSTDILGGCQLGFCKAAAFVQPQSRPPGTTGTESAGVSGCIRCLLDQQIAKSRRRRSNGVGKNGIICSGKRLIFDKSWIHHCRIGKYLDIFDCIGKAENISAAGTRHIKLEVSGFRQITYGDIFAGNIFRTHHLNFAHLETACQSKFLRVVAGKYLQGVDAGFRFGVGNDQFA